MARWQFIISDLTRPTVLDWVRRAPTDMVVQFIENKRSLEQNKLLWPLLTAVSRQVGWHGKKWKPDAWKDFFMHALGAESEFMPSETGGMVALGYRSSELSKKEFSDLIEVIYEFGARHGVIFPPAPVKEEEK
jgi:hypothetical protein